MTLVDIFVNVLDGLDRKDALHVDMAAELPEPEAWMGNDPSIVDLMTSNLKSLPSVTSSEIGIGILVNGSLLSEWFRESFRTFPILHARSSWIIGTAGTSGKNDLVR
jgi:hypothetical protein